MEEKCQDVSGYLGKSANRRRIGPIIADYGQLELLSYAPFFLCMAPERLAHPLAGPDADPYRVRNEYHHGDASRARVRART